MNSYLLYEPNSTLCAFTSTPKLKFKNSDPRGKIVQNIKKFPIRQNSDQTPKLYSTHQYESRDMLDFQNRAPDIKLLKIHTIRDD